MPVGRGFRFVFHQRLDLPVFCIEQGPKKTQEKRKKTDFHFCAFCVFLRLIDSFNDWLVSVAHNRFAALSRIAGDEASATDGCLRTVAYFSGTTCRIHTVSGVVGGVKIGQATERDRSHEDPKEKTRLVFYWRLLNSFWWVKLIHSSKLAESSGRWRCF